jgi:hypothetical protein
MLVYSYEVKFCYFVSKLYIEQNMGVNHGKIK